MNEEFGVTPAQWRLVDGLFHDTVRVLSERQAVRLRRAIEMAYSAHAGQTRDDGSPYIAHPLRVAHIVCREMKIHSPAAICAALLHDVLEDSATVKSEDIRMAFGANVARIVRLLTKPRRKQMTRVQVNAEYFRTIERADFMTRIIKLSDRLDNLRDLKNSRVKSRHARMLEETRQFYLPLIESFKDETLRKSLRLKFRLVLKAII